MARRCLTINLSPQCETPATREFKRPYLVREVLNERGRYVSAAHTIIFAWIIAGGPKTTCKALAGYSEWSDYCRQPLLWLGCSDPAASVFEALTEDPERETLMRMLDAWFGVLGKTPAMVRDAIDRMYAPNSEAATDLREVVIEVAGDRGDINRKKLGWWIRRHAGRIVQSKRFVRAAGNGSAERWRVEIVEPVS
jgi:hypothetical protein